MNFRYLGNSGLKISEITYGNWLTHGSQVENDVATQCVRAALDVGISTFDTADVYANTKAESVLGDALKGERRESLEIFTKVYWPTGPGGKNDTGLSRKHIMESINGSLTRLQTDYVDLYQAHHPDADTPIDETLRAFDDVVRAGKARYVGCSNYPAWQTARALGRSDVLGLARFDTVQPRYNLLFRQIERELLPLCEAEGLAVIPYNPLAGGFLSGKHRREGGPTAGTRFTLGTAAKRYQERYWREREFETVEEVRALAAEAGMSMVQLALAWVLAHPAMTSPIIGASRPAQLDDAIAAVGKTLDSSLKTRLDELTADYRLGDDVR